MNSASDMSNPLKRVAPTATPDLLQQVLPCQAVNSFMACQVAMARPSVVPAGAAGPEGTGYRAAPVQTGWDAINKGLRLSQRVQPR
jgi:hypothetical protein